MWIGPHTGRCSHDLSSFFLFACKSANNTFSMLHNIVPSAVFDMSKTFPRAKMMDRKSCNSLPFPNRWRLKWNNRHQTTGKLVISFLNADSLSHTGKLPKLSNRSTILWLCRRKLQLAIWCRCYYHSRVWRQPRCQRKRPVRMRKHPHFNFTLGARLL